MIPPAQAIGDKYATQISDAFLAWRDAYEAGEGTGTVHVTPFDPTELIRAAYEAAGVAGAEAITELVEGPRTGFAFNLRSPEAEKWISDYAAQEIRYVDAATKQTIRQITLRAFQEGLTPQQQSKLIRQHIGLLPQHAVAVQNYKDSLKDIDPALKDKLVDKYRQKLINYRAQTIALSESHSASNEGNRESVRQATKRGILDPDEYEMELFNHADKRICPICNALRGQRCPLPGGIYGGRSGPPFHPRCRDTEVTVRANKAKSKFRDASPEEFIQQRDKLPKIRRDFLTPYTADQYKADNVKLMLHASGGGGYGLKGNELISVFSLPGNHLGSNVVDDAISNGAERLDCLGDTLLDFYAQKGFKLVKTDKWDDQFAPGNWDYAKSGRPNLYYMELKK